MGVCRSTCLERQMCRASIFSESPPISDLPNQESFVLPCCYRSEIEAKFRQADTIFTLPNEFYPINVLSNWPRVWLTWSTLINLLLHFFL